MSDCSDMAASTSMRAKIKSESTAIRNSNGNGSGGGGGGEIHEIPITEFMKWSAFSYLDHSHLTRIKLAHVFGSGTEQTVALVTVDDDLYMAGYNVHGSLATGNANRFVQHTPIKIDALCKKSICDFSCGDDGGCLAIMALTEDGKVYGWAYNEYGELATGTPCEAPVLPTLVEGLKHENVKQLCCGADHVLVVTAKGTVYGWGYNFNGQVGDGMRLDVYTPTKITGDFSGKRVTQVACGMYHSVAITSDGDLYTWGRNDYGQLGLGHCRSIVSKLVPNKIELPSRIKKISCGSHHTMALTEDGELLCWGKNCNGELANGKTSKICTPVRVAMEISPIVDIASVHYSTINVCKTDKGQLFMWGLIRNKAEVNPIESFAKSMLDTFAAYSVPPATFKPLSSADTKCPATAKAIPSTATTTQLRPAIPQRSESTESQSVLNFHLRKAFNDSATSDIKFSVEGKILYAHKAILKIRSKYFRDLFETHRCEDNGDYILKIPEEVRYNVYKGFLLYFYTDNLELVEPSNYRDVLDLFKLADSIGEEVYLREKCATSLKYLISCDNAVDVYNVVKNCDDMVLEDFTFVFIVNHFIEMDKMGKFKDLDSDALRKLLRELHRRKELMSGDMGEPLSTSDFKFLD